MPALDRFQNINLLRRLNRAAQIVLAITFVAGLNYAGLRYHERFDTSQGRLYTLSPESRAYLSELRRPLHFVVTIPRDTEDDQERLLYRHVSNLLETYVETARDVGAEAVTVEYVDIYRNQVRARELAQDYGLQQPDTVLAISGDRHRFLLPADFVEFEDRVPVAFKGEQALTTVLLEVTSDKQPTLYFVIGHGEARLQDADPGRGLSALAQELTARGFRLGEVDLSNADKAPADADCLFIVDPQGPVLPEEEEVLRRYLREGAGRLVLLISPGREAGLDELLAEWGLLVDDAVVVEQGKASLEASGQILYRQFARHPITSSLIDNQTPVVGGLSRPVRADPGATPDERLAVTELIGSSPDSWGERGYLAAGKPQQDPVDLPGPVSIAAIAEREGSSRLGIRLPAGRFLVIGNGGLFANRRLNQLGNQTLALNVVNSMVERDRLLSLPPRPLQRYQMSASQEELRHLGLLYATVPLTTAFLGLAVYLARRR